MEFSLDLDQQINGQCKSTFTKPNFTNDLHICTHSVGGPLMAGIYRVQNMRNLAKLANIEQNKSIWGFIALQNQYIFRSINIFFIMKNELYEF